MRVRFPSPAPPSPTPGFRRWSRRLLVRHLSRSPVSSRGAVPRRPRVEGQSLWTGSIRGAVVSASSSPARSSTGTTWSVMSSRAMVARGMAERAEDSRPALTFGSRDTPGGLSSVRAIRNHYRMGDAETSLRAENAELRRLLEKHQWAGLTPVKSSGCCPECCGPSPPHGSGHRPGCAIAAILAITAPLPHDL